MARVGIGSLRRILGTALNRLHDRRAVVIGAATGLGAACAHAFAEEGARVVIGDVDVEGAERTAMSIGNRGGDATGLRVDIGEDSEVRDFISCAIDYLGGIDVLHLNAADMSAIGRDTTGVAEVCDQTWNRILRSNPTGFFFACRAAVPEMIAGGGGSIIMTSSTAAVRSEITRGAYGVSKAAVDALMRAVATAYGQRGIRCNSILPGAILTPEYRDGPRKWPQQIVDTHVRHALLPRIGNEADIANAALFLASDESAYITGHQLVVDGGLTIHMPHMMDELQIASGTGTGYGRRESRRR